MDKMLDSGMSVAWGYDSSRRVQYVTVLFVAAVSIAPTR